MYQGRSGNDVLAVQGLDVDFAQWPAGANPGASDHLDADSETFFVDIPGFGLDQMMNASVRILEVKEKQGETSATMDAVGRLEQQGRLVGVADVRAAQVGALIRAEGRRATKKPLAQPDDVQQIGNILIAR